MPFGLSCAPATFQSAMNTIFAHIIRKFVLVFVDDILVYSSSLQEHKQHLQVVFRILTDNKLSVKQSKCSFAQQSIGYLGYIISERGVSTDPEKVETIKKLPIPLNVKQLKGFLGLAGYYKKFIQFFGILCRALIRVKRIYNF